MMDLEQIRKKLSPLKASSDLVIRQVKAEKDVLKVARERLKHAEEAQDLVQAVAQDVQQKVHHRIASLVTRCLRAVFGPDSYEFRVTFDRKRGKTEARLSLVRGELEVEPTEASGGGVVDVVSFGLRVACLMLSRPAKRKLLALDEPLKHLSEGYVQAARDLIEALSEELGVQVLMVTHREALEVGNIVRLT